MSNLQTTKAQLIEYFHFLDQLRESGVTNMFGASPYIEEAFDGVDDKKARSILQKWMTTFDGERTPRERAEAILASQDAKK